MLNHAHKQGQNRWHILQVTAVLLWAGAALLLSGTVARAATAYVIDEVKLPFRSGPGTDRKIVDIISTGDRVEVLEDGEEWAMVRLRDGKEGWVLKRYLSSQKPSKLVLEELQQTHARLEASAGEIEKENETLQAENDRLKSSLEEKTKSLTELTQRYSELEKASEASNFQMRKYLIFFFSGAGILFIGILLGLVMKRQRRKSMYMV
jgi:SH3 domain protein